MATRKYNIVAKATDDIPAGALLTDSELKYIKQGKSSFTRVVPLTNPVRVNTKNIYWSFGLRFTTEVI